MHMVSHQHIGMQLTAGGLKRLAEPMAISRVIINRRKNRPRNYVPAARCAVAYQQDGCEVDEA